MIPDWLYVGVWNPVTPVVCPASLPLVNTCCPLSLYPLKGELNGPFKACVVRKGLLAI